MRIKYEEQVAFLEEQQASGETVRAFCERKGISIERFKWWQRSQRRRELDGTPSNFLPVVVQKPEQTHAGCRILVGNLISIECNSTIAPDVLELALQAAVRVCGRT